MDREKEGKNQVKYVFRAAGFISGNAPINPHSFLKGTTVTAHNATFRAYYMKKRGEGQPFKKGGLRNGAQAHTPHLCNAHSKDNVPGGPYIDDCTSQLRQASPD